MTRTSIFLLIACISNVGILFGQSDKAKLKEGNSFYMKGNFQMADSVYGSISPGEYQEIASFNQGDAKFKNSDFEDAITNFSEVARSSGSEELRADAYHNLGNTYMAREEAHKAIEAYKSALRLRPNDEDTRHNLAAALKMMKQQQNQDQQDQDQDQDQQDQEQQNQDQQDQDQDQQNQDQHDQDEQNQDQQNQDQQRQGEDDKDQQPQPHQISPQDAQRMLESLNKGEKEIQAKLKKAKGKAQKKKIEKDW
jgi:Ca-activated chloride channel homolog